MTLPTTVTPPTAVDTRADLWAQIDRLVDQAPRLSDLKGHRLNLLAGRHWRVTGREVPHEIEVDMRVAALTELVVPSLLARVREVIDGPMLVMKGPEVSARYNGRALRPFGDIDILVPNAEAAQHALMRAGFQPVGLEYLFLDIHHLRPLALPEIPLIVEVHSEPKWVEGLGGPPLAELFSTAVPSASGVDGVKAPAPEHHALLLAAHSWAHHPLRRIGDLIDIAVMSAGIDDRDLEALARSWRIGKVWRTTKAALEATLFEQPKPWALRVWARNLPAVRERTVLESHLDRLFASFWSLPPHRAVRAMWSAIGRAVRPEPWETWRAKRARVRRAIANAFLRRSEHEDALGQLSWSELVGRAVDAGDFATVRKLGVPDPQRAGQP